MYIVTILATALAAILGIALGYWIRHRKLVAEFDEVKEKGNNIIKKAKDKASDIRYEAKRDAKSIIQSERDELEKDYKKKQKELNHERKKYCCFYEIFFILQHQLL